MHLRNRTLGRTVKSSIQCIKETRKKFKYLHLWQKKTRNVFLRPFKTNSLVLLGGLDTYMNRSKKEEYQNVVDREIKRDDVEVTLELDEDNESDEGDDAATGR